ncbi:MULTISPECIES: FHA domain-containing protein [Eubacterium]|uniref:FHA domain protein n=1 Tax=Eubacterium ruminantium TaxID=42322 RepID=A0A1T4PB82_9FIRM|nr:MULTISPECIES: FHA domain-containing protein [Eubacterium]MCR5368796.1 FHA domain-containing protein [Eubacterium sp.]SCW58411.1 FHA domain protein [Eubacterium ruminantium]SDM99031.1 FHA domain protein [Eubacterium ruminantium]SJZ88739.1 FHA domain protein [Eubacterium ruminantium]
MGMTEENAEDQQISYDEFTLNFKLQEDIPVEQFELSMFNYEFVGNRTVCSLKVVDNVRVLQYKIPATLPLEQFFRKQLYKGEFLSILSNILNQLMYFEENKMPLNKILLNVHYMYIELSTLDIQLIYMPVNKKFPDCNITKFIQTFISKVRYANMECVEAVEQILHYLDSKLMFNLAEFYHFILSLEAETILEDEKEEKENDTSVLIKSSKEYENPIPYLVRVKTNELIPILKREFLVGKSPDADYQVTDNRRISRRHAIFTVSNGECYVIDNNSTNHTFVNGKLLQPGVEIMLSNDDYIRLADEEFKYWVR